MSGLWGTGLVLQEVSLIADRIAPIAAQASFGREALVFDLAKQLRAAMLDLEADVVTADVQQQSKNAA